MFNFNNLRCYELKIDGYNCKIFYNTKDIKSILDTLKIKMQTSKQITTERSSNNKGGQK